MDRARFKSERLRSGSSKRPEQSSLKSRRGGLLAFSSRRFAGIARRQSVNEVCVNTRHERVREDRGMWTRGSGRENGADRRSHTGKEVRGAARRPQGKLCASKPRWIYRTTHSVVRCSRHGAIRHVPKRCRSPGHRGVLSTAAVARSQTVSPLWRDIPHSKPLFARTLARGAKDLSCYAIVS